MYIYDISSLRVKQRLIALSLHNTSEVEGQYIVICYVRKEGVYTSLQKIRSTYFLLANRSLHSTASPISL